MKKHNYLIIDGVFCDRYGNPLKGVALYNAMATHLNGGLKQTLDQNEELKRALYYSLNNEQDVMDGILEVTDNYSRIRYVSTSSEEVLSTFEKFSILDTWHAVQQIYKNESDPTDY